MNWIKVLLREEEVHIQNPYLLPGQKSIVEARTDTMINSAMDIIWQDPTAKIILEGDLIS